MRPLDRLRVGVVVGDGVVLAVEAEGAIGETALEDRDRLRQTSLAHRRSVERDADRLVLRTIPPSADRNVEAALREHVQRGKVLGQDRRVAQVVVEHEAGDPQPLRGRGDRRHGRDRRRLGDEVVRDDEGVDPDRLSAAGGLGQLAPARDRARLGQESERLHVPIVPGSAGYRPRAGFFRGRAAFGAGASLPLPDAGPADAIGESGATPPTAPRSARMTCITALISDRCVKACGKLPRCRPVSGSSSSPYRPRGDA